MERSAWKAIGCARRQLLGSSERDHRIIHENSGHGLDAAFIIFAGLAASDFSFCPTVKESLEHAGITDEISYSKSSTQF
jgi:hypothetical protein